MTASAEHEAAELFMDLARYYHLKAVGNRAKAADVDGELSTAIFEIEAAAYEHSAEEARAAALFLRGEGERPDAVRIGRQKRDGEPNEKLVTDGGQPLADLSRKKLEVLFALSALDDQEPTVDELCGHLGTVGIDVTRKWINNNVLEFMERDFVTRSRGEWGGPGGAPPYRYTLTSEACRHLERHVERRLEQLGVGAMNAWTTVIEQEDQGDRFLEEAFCPGGCGRVHAGSGLCDECREERESEEELVADGGAVEIGALHGASVLDVDGEAVLAIKGTDGAARVEIPKEMIEPFRDTVSEVRMVYDGYDPSDPDVLIGDGAGGYPCDRCEEVHDDRGDALECCSEVFEDGPRRLDNPHWRSRFVPDGGEDAESFEIGTRVRTNREFSGVPAGTEGVVDEDYGSGVMVAWDLPDRPLPDGYEEVPEDVVRAMTTGPDGFDVPVLRDGFSKETELQFLDLVEEAGIATDGGIPLQERRALREDLGAYLAEQDAVTCDPCGGEVDFSDVDDPEEAAEVWDDHVREVHEGGG